MSVVPNNFQRSCGWQDAPLLTVPTGKEEVTDAGWSPSQSTVLACTTAGGCLQLWDLAASTLRPVDSHQLTSTTSPQGTASGPSASAPASSSSPALLAGPSPAPESSKSPELASAAAHEKAPAGAGVPTSGDEEKDVKIGMECMAFSDTAPVIAAGDTRGVVSLFRLWDADLMTASAEQSAALLKALQIA